MEVAHRYLEHERLKDELRSNARWDRAKIPDCCNSLECTTRPEVIR